jgi:hypothetical protein
MHFPHRLENTFQKLPSGDHAPHSVGDEEEDPAGRAALLRGRQSHPEHAAALASASLGEELFRVTRSQHYDCHLQRHQKFTTQQIE